MTFSLQKLILSAALAITPALTFADDLPLSGSIDVSAPSVLSSLREEQPVGVYNQPGWVKSRRFSTTRVHIQRDPWEVAFEQWWRGRMTNGDWSHRMQEEIEIGLPGRFQLDLYQDWTIDKDGKAEHLDFAAEIRWGLADWGEIPLNPALYFEYKWTDPSRGGDVIEPKILFGDDFGEGWHWGLNLVYERELSGEKAEEYQITQGISRTLMDEVFSVGMEMKYVRETVAGARNDPDHKFLIGPSVQWKPRDNMHLDLVALAGVTKASPDLETWLVFGIDFGGPAKSKKASSTVSGRR
jgi:Putative MetA-pathway of phenol degradation